jgi:hypothetical protein
MKQKNASTELIKQLCGEIREDDGVDPRLSKRREQKPDYEKRDRRLGAQIRRELELVLPELFLRSGVRFCEILSVEPAGEAGPSAETPGASRRPPVQRRRDLSSGHHEETGNEEANVAPLPCTSPTPRLMYGIGSRQNSPHRQP